MLIVLKDEDVFDKALFKTRIGTEDATWKNAVKVWCPIAKKPMKQIFIDLENAGLSKEDIVHLEYMDNPAILNLSGIPKTLKKTKSVKVGTRDVPRTDFWGRTFSLKTTEDVFEDRTTEETYNYWIDPKNLVKYLKAWVSILKEEREQVASDEYETLSKQVIFH